MAKGNRQGNRDGQQQRRGNRQAAFGPYQWRIAQYQEGQGGAQGNADQVGDKQQHGATEYLPLPPANADTGN